MAKTQQFEADLAKELGLGRPWAQNNLGVLYRLTIRRPNYPRAIFWYRKSAEKVSKAQFNLGQLFKKVFGRPGGLFGCLQVV